MDKIYSQRLLLNLSVGIFSVAACSLSLSPPKSIRAYVQYALIDLGSPSIMVNPKPKPSECATNIH